MTYAGAQYQLVTESVTWSAALSACQALGATWSLASFHSEAEWQVGMGQLGGSRQLAPGRRGVTISRVWGMGVICCARGLLSLWLARGAVEGGGQCFFSASPRP